VEDEESVQVGAAINEKYEPADGKAEKKYEHKANVTLVLRRYDSRCVMQRAPISNNYRPHPSSGIQQNGSSSHGSKLDRSRVYRLSPTYHVADAEKRTFFELMAGRQERRKRSNFLGFEKTRENGTYNCFGSSSIFGYIS
jgi:hypothetical protein